MLKYVLLAGAMTISAPALAQSKPADTPTAPTTQVAPAQTAPQAAPLPANSGRYRSAADGDPGRSDGSDTGQPHPGAGCAGGHSAGASRSNRTARATGSRRACLGRRSGRAGREHRIPDLRQGQERHAQPVRIRCMDDRAQGKERSFDQARTVPRPRLGSVRPLPAPTRTRASRSPKPSSPASCLRAHKLN